MHTSTVLQARTRSPRSTWKSGYVLDWHREHRLDNRLTVIDLAGRSGSVQSERISRSFEGHCAEKDRLIVGYPPAQTRRHLHRRNSVL